MSAKEVSEILILGGYGRAGKEIAWLLGLHTKHRITVAGRSLVSAQNCARELNSSLNIDRIAYKGIDVNLVSELNEAVNSVDVVIVALPLSGTLTENLIGAVLNGKCQFYLDISPGRLKHKAFQMNHDLISKSNKTFVIDAGCEPGMPAILIKYLKTLDPKITDVKINVVYREREMPDSSVRDLLLHDESVRILKNGVWSLSKNKVRRISFPLGFGKLRTVPVWIPELENIHRDAQITDLEYRHAGINGVSNIISFLWKSSIKTILPIRLGVRLFKWAIKKFTKDPIGGLLVIEGDSGYKKTTLQAYHEDIYVATAIPAVATLVLMLKNGGSIPGSHFTYQVVNVPAFISQCNQMGFKIMEIVESNSKTEKTF